MIDIPDTKKGTILIADDAEMNRDFLEEMLIEEFDILLAKDGQEAIDIIDREKEKISLILLDIVMPVQDGFDVLFFLRNKHLTSHIPTIIISSEASSPSIDRAYKLGATDYITRPFSKTSVRHKVITTITAYSEKTRLYEQILARERDDSLMVSILANVVEFRNGESGLHVLHINNITEILLRHLMQLDSSCQFSAREISAICMASSLHDIGKIAVPENILNKPGKLTNEEFSIMKTHSAAGAAIIETVKDYEKEPLMKYAHNICRWHHERWDGNGYPDGISGDDIPIYVQIVSIADVYDALTNERVYKPAYPHEKAIQMINNGECGVFNPKLIECLNESADEIKEIITLPSFSESIRRRVEDAVMETMYGYTSNDNN